MSMNELVGIGSSSNCVLNFGNFLLHSQAKQAVPTNPNHAHPCHRRVPLEACPPVRGRVDVDRWHIAGWPGQFPTGRVASATRCFTIRSR